MDGNVTPKPSTGFEDLCSLVRKTTFSPKPAPRPVSTNTPAGSCIGGMVQKVTPLIPTTMSVIDDGDGVNDLRLHNNTGGTDTTGGTNYVDKNSVIDANETTKRHIGVKASDDSGAIDGVKETNGTTHLTYSNHGIHGAQCTHGTRGAHGIRGTPSSSAFDGLNRFHGINSPNASKETNDSDLTDGTNALLLQTARMTDSTFKSQPYQTVEEYIRGWQSANTAFIPSKLALGSGKPAPSSTKPSLLSIEPEGPLASTSNDNNASGASLAITDSNEHENDDIDALSIRYQRLKSLSSEGGGPIIPSYNLSETSIGSQTPIVQLTLSNYNLFMAEFKKAKEQLEHFKRQEIDLAAREVAQPQVIRDDIDTKTLLKLNDILQEASDLETKRDSLLNTVAQLAAERDDLLRNNAGLLADIHGLTTEQDGLLRKNNDLMADVNGLLSTVSGLMSEVDGCTAREKAAAKSQQENNDQAEALSRENKQKRQVVTGLEAKSKAKDIEIKALHNELKQAKQSPSADRKIISLEAQLRSKSAEADRHREDLRAAKKMVETKTIQLQKAATERLALRGGTHLVSPNIHTKLPQYVLGCLECYMNNAECDHEVVCSNCKEAGKKCVRWRCSIYHRFNSCPDRVACTLKHSTEGWLITLNDRPVW
ncbi:hypothetical protein B0J11DRAFT_586221 [Dendryphion nanum]|uniref:Uncharacterized protein n=1 Tax=Dendryphion nanum TaxID=256645 RepID=A0A9P9I7X7_9PLEO|nr:hypothetical protein B0J11DRAFT_586221 [Dendryphion nanum]